MDPIKKEIKIELSIWQKQICLKIKKDEIYHWFYQPIPENKVRHQEIIYFWILSKLKHAFYLMPVKHIKVDHSKEVVDYLGEYLKICLVILKNTNDLIGRYHNKKNSAGEFKRVLMFNVGGNQVGLEHYNHASRKFKEKVLYQDMVTGFNAELRVWEHADPPFEIDDLVKYLLANQVKRIISINHYLLEKYLFMKGYYLLAVLDYLGMDYVIIDQDVYELSWHGYLHQDLFNNAKWQRYSHSNVHEYWNSHWQQENISYIGLINFTKKESKSFDIDPEYKIAIMSHSRFENVKNALPVFLYVTHHLGEENLFYNFQIWYRALRYMILEMMQMDDLEKMYYLCQLISVFYTSIQILKFEVIENLKTEHLIEIYGDNGWGKVFPQYFQNAYLDQKAKDDMLRSKKYMVLIPPSFAVNLLFRELTILDAISNGVPFLYMSSQAKLAGFEAMDAVEYSSNKDLNSKIDRIDKIYQNQELLNTLEKYRRLIVDHSIDFTDHLFSIETADHLYRGYDPYLDQVDADLDKSIKSFIDKNEIFLRNCFNVLLKGDRVNFDLARARFAGRSYVKKISAG